MRSEIDLRKIGVREVPMLGVYRTAEAVDGLLPHAHPGCLEICCLARGRQQYRVNGRDFIMRGGDVFLTWPGEVHDTGGAPQERSVLYWLIIARPATGRAFLGCPPGEAAALDRALRDLPHRHFPGEPRLGEILEEIFSLYARGGAGESPELCRLGIRTRLLDFLLRVADCANAGRAPEVTPPIGRAMRHAEQRLDAPLPLAELAKVARLSLPRFKARFRQEVGLPPSEYVTRCRIEQAKRALRTGQRGITELAFEFGFSSSQHFATVFRRYTGLRPTDWRRQTGSPNVGFKHVGRYD